MIDNNGESNNKEQCHNTDSSQPPVIRVSVGVLARLILFDKTSNTELLALERRGTAHQTAEGAKLWRVQAVPFGGAVTVNDPDVLRQRIGDFEYDNDHSRQVKDFRLIVNPSAWDTLKTICQESFEGKDQTILEFDPFDELHDEIKGATGISIERDDLIIHPIGIHIENEAAPTDNIFSFGVETLRFYGVFEAKVQNEGILHQIIDAANTDNDTAYGNLAIQDLQSGGKGWVNTVLVLNLAEVENFYRDLAPSVRDNEDVLFKGFQLARNVSVVVSKKYPKVL